MKGLVLAGGTGGRLAPCTDYVNKHFLHVYDRPLIYFPISQLLLLNCREIYFVCNSEDIHLFERLVNSLRDLGIKSDYVVQCQKGLGLPSAILSARELIGNSRFCTILGDNFITGNHINQSLLQVMTQSTECICFTKKVAEPQNFGVLVRDEEGEPTRLIEKPTKPLTNEAVIGLYAFPEQSFDIFEKCQLSSRGETEIVDVLNSFLSLERLKALQLPRGVFWMDAGTPENLFNCSEFLRTIHSKQLEQIGCIEEIVIEKGFKPRDLSEVHKGVSQRPSVYNSYVKSVIEQLKSDEPYE